MRLKAYGAWALLLTLTVFWSACSKSIPKFDTKKDPTRVIAIAPMGGMPEPEQTEELMASVAAAVGELYQPVVYRVAGVERVGQELPTTSLHEAALKSADDLLVVIFPVAGASQESQSLKLRQFNLNDFQQRFVVDVALGEGFDLRLKQALATQISDLSAFPKGSALQVARVLEKRGALKEALAIYLDQKARQGTLFIQDLNSRDELDRKIEEIRPIVERDDLLLQDKYAVYDLNMEFRNISRPSQEQFAQILSETKFQEYVGRYTDKPATVKVEFGDDQKTGAIRLELRFQQEWYWKAVGGQPKDHLGYRILHFSPYFALMMRLADLKEQWLKRLATTQVALPETFHVALVLKQLLGDEVEIPVVMNAAGRLLFPYELRVKIHGFEEVMMSAASKSIFERQGFFTLGPAQLLNGQQTQWGLLYRFFGIEGPKPEPEESLPIEE